MSISMELLTQKNRDEPICDRCHQAISFNAPYCLYSNGWKEHAIHCPRTDEQAKQWINAQIDEARMIANLPIQRFGIAISPEYLNQKVTIIINNRNWLTMPKKMVEVMQTWDNVGDIWICDNCSDYDPLLDWYNEIEKGKHNSTSLVNVLACSSNWGHTAPWAPDIRYDGKSLVDLVPTEFFIETDPDLELDKVPKDVIPHFIRGMIENPDRIKVGLSLEINDLIDNGLLMRKEIMGFEGMNWRSEVGKDWYNAPIDTTLAIYEKSRYMIPGDFNRSLRSKRPYTARHLPWYFTKANLTEEQRYYINHCEGSSNFASRVKSRI